MVILPDNVYTICWVKFSLLPLCFFGPRKVNFSGTAGFNTCMHRTFASYCSDNCDFGFHSLGLLLLGEKKKGRKRGKNPGRQTASTAGTAGELNCRFLPSINLTLYQTLSIAILKIPSFYLYRVDILKENSIWESTARKNKIWLQGTKLLSWNWVLTPLGTSVELQSYTEVWHQGSHKQVKLTKLVIESTVLPSVKKWELLHWFQWQ